VIPRAPHRGAGGARNRAISDTTIIEMDGYGLQEHNLLTDNALITYDAFRCALPEVAAAACEAARMGEAAFNPAGLAASTATAGTNVTEAITHGNASATTIVHMTQIAAIAANGRWSGSVTVHDWYKLVLGMKAAKLGIRGTQLASQFVLG
jgi:hypothetical protein